MTELTTRRPRVLSLFAGIGGIDRGLESALGAETVLYSEVDEYASSVMAARYPDAVNLGDITKIDWSTLTDEHGTIDIICGGFPCQDLSYAGKGAGIADGTRSGLWAQYADAIRILRPRLVVVENVAALLARGLGRVLGDMAACGYDAEWDCVPAAGVGAPHRRDRLFIVAYPSGVQRPAIVGGEPHGAAASGRALPDADGEQERVEPVAHPGSGAPAVARADGDASTVADAEGEPEREPTDQGVAVAARGEARMEPRGGGEPADVADPGGQRPRNAEPAGARRKARREPTDGGAYAPSPAPADPDGDGRTLVAAHRGRDGAVGSLALVDGSEGDAGRGVADPDGERREGLASGDGGQGALDEQPGDDAARRGDHPGGRELPDADGLDGRQGRPGRPRREGERHDEPTARADGRRTDGDLPDADGPGREGHGAEHQLRSPARAAQAGGVGGRAAQPRLGRAADGLPTGMDEPLDLTAWPRPYAHPFWDGDWEAGVPRTAEGVVKRVDRLRCLGNAVVPQVAEHVGLVAIHRGLWRE